MSIVEPIPASQFKEVLENAVSRVEDVSGRFTQVSGFEIKVDLDGIAQELDDEGNVLTPGTRIIEVKLEDGTFIVQGGDLVANAPAISIATIDFLARGGDNYPYRETPFSALGVTYQQALANYLTEGLSGVVTNNQYPEGGSGRIEYISSLQDNDSGDTRSEMVNENAPNQVTKAYPNPFVDAFDLDVTVDFDGPLTISLYNTQGSLLKILFESQVAKGNYTIEVKGLGSLTKGVYYVKVQTNEDVRTFPVIKE